ncbi:regulatory protein, TetR, partial [Pseudomonas syringae pv. pisi str. 1704B]
GLAFSQSQGHLRRYLEDMYGKVFRRYMTLVNEAAPRIPPIELFWRVHFMLGAAAFSMSGIKALRAIAETDFGVNTSIEQVMRLMVPFLAGADHAMDTGESINHGLRVLGSIAIVVIGG